MWHLLLFFSFVHSYASQCGCSSGTLQQSFAVAPEVFTGQMLNAPTNSVLIRITEVFKTTRRATERSPTVFLRYDCKDMPQLPPGQEGVFFATHEGGFYMTLMNCTRNGYVTPTEKTQLRALTNSCISPSGLLLKEGDYSHIGCHMCRCHAGKFQCPTTPCYPTPSPLPIPSPSTYSCRIAETGQMLPEGSTTMRKSPCQECTCTSGWLSCKPAVCCTGQDGQTKEQGESWWWNENGCNGLYSCSEGTVRELPHGSGAYCQKQQLPDMLIVGTSLTGGFLVVLLVWMIVIARRRMQAMAEPRDIPLEDREDSDNDVGPSISTHHPYTSVQTQSFSNFYNNTSPHGIQTTPMVLMTQTGEPVVVQVAYI